MHTTDPAYWAAKLDEAERRVRLAAKALARLTTPNGHPSTVPTGRGRPAARATSTWRRCTSC